MYYSDLRSLDDVNNLSMPELNLRLHCLDERIQWETGAGSIGDVFDPEPESEPEMKPMGKKQLIDVLAEIKQHQLAEEAKRNANR